MTAQTILPANSVVDSGFDVANSARFEGGTPDSLRLAAGGDDGDQKHWTVSMWIKRSKLGSLQHVWGWSRNNTNAEGGFAFDTNDQIFFISDGQNGGTNEIDGAFKDTAAWFHLVWSCDADNGTNALRWRVYINGVERAITGDPTIQDANGIINRGSSQEHWIGGRARSVNSNTGDSPFSGYIAEVVFIDDATLGPTSFGEFDEDTGIWKPLKSVEDLTFGAKGYYLNFQDSAELGTDVSGNDYDFAETGLTAIDQSTDTCTNNFATLNPLDNFFPNHTYSDGNLTSASGTADGSPYTYVTSSMGFNTGKWYWEFKAVAKESGIDNWVTGFTSQATTTTTLTYSAGTHGYGMYGHSGVIYNDGSSAYGSGFTTGNIVMIAVDMDNLGAYWGVNGTWLNSSDPESGSSRTGAKVITAPTGDIGVYLPSWFWYEADVNGTASFNFGSPSYAISSGNADGNGFGNFEYAVPSGYFAICSKNLAEHG